MEAANPPTTAELRACRRLADEEASWRAAQRGAVHRGESTQGASPQGTQGAQEGASEQAAVIPGRDAALLVAAANDHTETVEALLAAKACLRPRKQHWTALTCAARWGSTAVVRILLRAKASADERDARGTTPLALAADQGHRDVARVLLEAESEQAGRASAAAKASAVFVQAVQRGHAGVVRALVDAKVRVDKKRECVWTSGSNRVRTVQPPCVFAVSLRHWDVVRVLVRSKAYPDHCLDECLLPDSDLSEGLCAAREATIRLLLRAKACPDTPLLRVAAPFPECSGQPTIPAHVRTHILRLLFACKASVNGAADAGPNGNLLVSAAARGTSNLPVVACLLEAKANVNPRRHAGGFSSCCSPLEHAAAFGADNLPTVVALLEAKARVLNKDGGSRALYAAAASDHRGLPVVVALLAAKADSGVALTSALHGAAASSSADVAAVIRALVEARADVLNATNRLRALCTAASLGPRRLPAVVALLAAKAAVAADALFAAATHGSVDAASALLDAQADVGARDENRCTALMVAARERSSNTEMAQLLLRAKARLEDADSFGCTALAHCVKAGSWRVQTMRMLVAAKACVNTHDVHGHVPLVHAIRGGNVETVQTLLRAKANPECKGVADALLTGRFFDERDEVCAHVTKALKRLRKKPR